MSVEERLAARISEAGSLTDLQTVAYETAVAKGWHEAEDCNLDFPRWSMMMVTEIAEAVQAHRKGAGTAAVGEELADTVIRLLDTAAAMGIDLEQAIRRKMLRNLDRERRQGGLPY